MTQLTTMDKLAMYLGGGLILLGIPVLGLVMAFAGGDSPPFDPLIRGYLVLLGLVILMLLSISKLFTPEPSA